MAMKPSYTTCRDTIPEEEYWRVVPIIEGILTDSHHYELAVNVPNDGFIDYLPSNQIVEVPAIIDKNGIHGVKFDHYPKAFGALLMTQVAVNDMTTEAVLNSSKEAALQAMLVDPICHDARAAENLLDTMISLQAAHLGYLK